MSEKGRRMTSAARVLHLERSFDAGQSRDNKTDGPGGVGSAVTPGLTLGTGGLMANNMPPAGDNTGQAR